MRASTCFLLFTWLLASFSKNAESQSHGIAAAEDQLFACGVGGNFIKTSTNCTNRIGQALFRNEINDSGWAYLEIETYESFADEIQAYAAGALEGQISSQLIKWHWKNTVAGYCKDAGEYCNKLDHYISDNLAWIKTQIIENNEDPYWRQVKLMLIQLAGLEDGYFGNVNQPHMEISTFGFLMFQLSGDFEDLEQALNKPKKRRRPMFSRESCSALVVPLVKNQDLYFSHVTWSVYQSMLRIQKLYKFAYSLNGIDDASVPTTTITFSSYPGTLLSVDDFYLLSSGLAVMETTIGNSNSSLFQYITPNGTILSWIRVMVANRLSSTSKQWVDTFTRHNSGTYNNQFMILDYKKFEARKPLAKSELFYVVEQIPGYVQSKDMSTLLRKQGYWPSYNVPYFPDIFNLSGNLDNVKKYGDWFTYEKTPRALIFARDWQSVKDMDSFLRLMRYNNFKNDPLSVCNCTPPFSAENAISARNDLNLANGTYPFKQLGHRSHGGTDVKATNAKLFEKLQFMAISGPTYDNLPPFKWSETDFAATIPHFGHPDIFAFKPVINKWKLL